MLFRSPCIVPGRRIDGISAVLLPMTAGGAPDLDAWAALVERTWSAGLTPAINMDTGYANLLSRDGRLAILGRMRDLSRGRTFVAGAYIEGEPGDPATLYSRECAGIMAAGGTPILFPCTAIQLMDRAGLTRLFRAVAAGCPRFLGFELGTMFVPFGRLWDLPTFEALMEIPQLAGAKHSSLSRQLEWDRLRLRDRVRPEFRIYTGNDLAIDMVKWGSDYLLGLSAFHVEAFAARDRMWADEDPRFHELNDWLQYLGMLTFRGPVPAYKHSCAQFLRQRGLIASSEPFPGSLRRPDSDLALLEAIRLHLDNLVLAARGELP